MIRNLSEVARTMMVACGVVASCVAGLPGAARATPTFNLTFISGTSAQAQADFTAAANFWASQFTDNVAINLTVGTASLGGSILGETTSAEARVAYSSLRSALSADKTSANDTIAVNNLPASSLSVYINHTSDNKNGSNSATPYVTTESAAQILMTTANAKALGYSSSGGSLSVASGASCTNCDALIEFSTDYSWDYTQSDGISSGLYDFTGAAIHEIGHALGFMSGVDTLNSFATTSPTTAGILTGFDIMPLDLFRCSTASKSALANIDFTEDTRTKYFTLNECATASTTTPTAQFADGASSTYGDGYQASHWKNGLGLGIMNPTLAAGTQAAVTANDLIAYDAIGWNLSTAAAATVAAAATPAPEPASIALAGVWLAGLAGARRRRVRT